MGALENQTVIVVTHQVEFLSKVDKILVSFQHQGITLKAFEHLANAHMDSIAAIVSQANNIGGN
jgi:ATP-binding cassette, subfamily C (CFTR/MRP), member 1